MQWSINIILDWNIRYFKGRIHFESDFEDRRSHMEDI